MEDEGLNLEEMMERFDADPIDIKHHRVDKKLSEIQDQLEVLQDHFPNE